MLEYQANNETLTEKSNTSIDETKYKINDEIKIYYNPKKASEFIIGRDSTLSLFGVIMIIFGLAFTISSVLTIIRRR